MSHPNVMLSCWPLKNTSKYGDARERRKLADHLLQTRLLEEVYRQLFDTLDKSSICQYTPAEQIWAAISRTSETSAAVGQRPRAAAKEPSSQFDRVVSLKISASDKADQDSEEIDADSAMNMLADALFATLQMLAYRESWFREG